MIDGRHCPNAECNERLIRPLNQGGGLLVKTKNLRLQEEPSAVVIRCPKCKQESTVAKGRLLIFRRPRG